MSAPRKNAKFKDLTPKVLLFVIPERFIGDPVFKKRVASPYSRGKYV